MTPAQLRSIDLAVANAERLEVERWPLLLIGAVYVREPGSGDRFERYSPTTDATQAWALMHRHQLALERDEARDTWTALSSDRRFTPAASAQVALCLAAIAIAEAVASTAPAG